MDENPKLVVEYFENLIKVQNELVESQFLPKIIHDNTVEMVKHLQFVVDYIKDTEMLKSLNEK